MAHRCRYQDDVADDYTALQQRVGFGSFKDRRFGGDHRPDPAVRQQ
jgi:hypothetical protein